MTTAVFVIRDRESNKAIFIRHRCISCVRELAVTSSPAEEFALWSDRDRTSVALAKDLPPGLNDHGKVGVLMRVGDNG